MKPQDPNLPGTPDRTLNNSAEQLLNATADLLAGRSAMDVSLSDISKRSGLNSALIKYYFGNKDGLMLAVLERDAVKAMAALKHLVEMPLSARRKLEIHVSGIVNAYFRSPYLNRLIHFMIEYGDPNSSRRVDDIYVKPMIEAYTAIVAQGVAEGSFEDVDPKFLYFSLVGACDHIFHATYSAPGTLRAQKVTEEVKQNYIAHVTRIFLAGLRPGIGRQDVDDQPLRTVRAA